MIIIANFIILIIVIIVIIKITAGGLPRCAWVDIKLRQCNLLSEAQILSSIVIIVIIVIIATMMSIIIIIIIFN